MILCWHPDYQTARRRDVRPGGDDLVLKLSFGRRMRGRITDAATQTPIAGARLVANDVRGFHKDAMSQEDGSFVLAGLNAGSRTVSVTVSAEGFARLRKKITVVENAEVEQDFALEATGAILGIVVNSNGDPVRSARVMAKRLQDGSGVEQNIGNEITDADGSFTIRNVESGKDTYIRVKKGEYLDGYSDAFTIQPQAPAGSAAAKKPLKAQTFNPADGTFEYQGVPAGVYSIQVRAPELAVATISDVQVPEGEAVALGRIVLQSTAKPAID